MVFHNLGTAWQRLLPAQPPIAWRPSRGATFRPSADVEAAIHQYDRIDDFTAWERCRNRARFHLGRARRAKDRNDYRAAAREIERALRYDDTSESYFQVLGQCHLNGSPPDLAAARQALERALEINPRNGYTIQLLLQVYDADGSREAADTVLKRAREAGAPPTIWRDGQHRSRGLEPVSLGA
jgi:tetratricopeptide (TPR) repeat protein